MADNYRPEYRHYASRFESSPVTGNSYRTGYGPTSPIYPDLHPPTLPRSSIYPDLHPPIPLSTIYPHLHPPRRPSTNQHTANHCLPSTHRPDEFSCNTDEYHHDLPYRDRGQPPDYDSVCRPSKKIKMEEQDLHVPRPRETVVKVLDDADDEPQLYHKRPMPDNTNQRNEAVLRASTAPGSRLGRLSAADFAKPMDQAPLSLDRPTLMPLAPSSKSSHYKASSQDIKITDPATRKAFKQARGQLYTCRNSMQGMRTSLGSRYEKDDTMKDPRVHAKLSELNEYLRQVEDGLVGAVELITEFIRG